MNTYSYRKKSDINHSKINSLYRNKNNKLLDITPSQSTNNNIEKSLIESYNNNNNYSNQIMIEDEKKTNDLSNLISRKNYNLSKLGSDISNKKTTSFIKQKLYIFYRDE